MASTITFYTRNILETADSVTVTGTPDTGYPESRLHDRSIDLYWKDTVTEAKTFVVDTSSDIRAVDLLYIPRHNFNGEDMQWQYSTTGAWAGEEVDACTDWTQSGNTPIIKTIETAQNREYWRVTLSSMANPQASEIYMSGGITFTILAEPAPVKDRVSNAQWNRTIGGQERSTLYGDLRYRYQYTLRLTSGIISTFNTVLDDLNQLSYPFLLLDHESEYKWVRFTEDPSLPYPPKNHVLTTLSMIEVL